MGQHLDMAQFLGGGVHQQVAELRVAARAAGLEEILHCDTDLTLHATDGLLQGTGEQRVRGVDANGILKLVVGIEHDASIAFQVGKRSFRLDSPRRGV